VLASGLCLVRYVPDLGLTPQPAYSCGLLTCCKLPSNVVHIARRDSLGLIITFKAASSLRLSIASNDGVINFTSVLVAVQFWSMHQVTACMVCFLLWHCSRPSGCVPCFEHLHLHSIWRALQMQLSCGGALSSCLVMNSFSLKQLPHGRLWWYFENTSCFLLVDAFSLPVLVLVLLMWPSTNQTPQNWSHDCTLNHLMHTF